MNMAQGLSRGTREGGLTQGVRGREGGLMQGVRAREVRFTPNSCYGERGVTPPLI